MKRHLIALLMFTLAGYPAHGQVQALRWGEFGCYSNWNRCSYEVKSSYEFIGRLPDLREFPKLLSVALDPKLDPGDRPILISQLRTLSRCSFEKSTDGGGDVEDAYRASVARWKDWWNNYGSKLPGELEKHGGRNEKAWKQIAPSPYLEVPAYPILIPGSWSSTLSFRSGDYAGVTEEVIEFRVADDNCSLRRRYRTGWMGKEPWTQEVWRGFSRKEADHFLASLIYLIDHPWFYSRDQLSASEGGGKQAEISHIRGRPKAWSDYYPGYEWTGILDADHQVIINHDPWTWESIDHAMGPKTSLDGAGFGIVFRLVRDVFPDPSWAPGSSRWKRVNPGAEQKDGLRQGP